MGLCLYLQNTEVPGAANLPILSVMAFLWTSGNGSSEDRSVETWTIHEVVHLPVPLICGGSADQLLSQLICCHCKVVSFLQRNSFIFVGYAAVHSVELGKVGME